MLPKVVYLPLVYLLLVYLLPVYLKRAMTASESWPRFEVQEVSDFKSQAYGLRFAVSGLLSDLQSKHILLSSLNQSVLTIYLLLSF